MISIWHFIFVIVIFSLLIILFILAVVSNSKNKAMARLPYAGIYCVCILFWLVSKGLIVAKAGDNPMQELWAFIPGIIVLGVLGRFGSERVVSTGLSRWHTLWGLVPIAGWIWLAVLCFIPPGNFGAVPTAGEKEAKGL